MKNRPRTARVLVSLVVSMTIGAVVLMALDSRPAPAGAFSLASYSRLNAIADLIEPTVAIVPERWNCIEVYYSKTTGGNIEQIASLSGLRSARDANFHFAIYNGKGGDNGQIETTEKWLRQWSCVPTGTWYGTGSTIRICVVANSQSQPVTDIQRKRTSALVEELSRQLGVPASAIHYPADWQL